MNVCVIGAGYVGLTTSTVLANFGHKVICVEQLEEKVNMLSQGEVPIYEPGLEDMLKENVRKGTLEFTTNLSEAVKRSSVIFIAVGTPQDKDGKTDLRFFHEVSNDLSPLIDTHKVIITKSTVPIGTNEELNQTFLKNGVSESLFDVVSNPEFLREGTAIHDMLYPDKIVVGLKNHQAVKVLQKLYHFIDAPYVITNLSGAEMIKYASNAFLAVKISFINELAQLADVCGVDITEVALGIGMDPRIGHHFLQAGLGYGGSCLPKDLSSLEHQSITRNVTPHMLQAAQSVNDSIIAYYMKKIKKEFPDFQKKNITIWGATFKPNTDDMRHSQALKLVDQFVNEGCHVHLYDPVVSPKLNHVTNYKDMYESIREADMVIIATEWKQFIEADWKVVRERMRGNTIVDCRNALQPYKIRSHGLRYVGVARP
ncbi:UDP-glucose/GDP-mannose dehydrogenase family protein [Alkalihalobacillus sp. MEB130]|uniref:UDP-glucose dehydrogenase family protein n=1 Tax=Alkalihalobacillus sp. MEB130 TaxID=2976704 RepID=UPI0028DEE976|nr:UDP-glucose/GDP-mannose dehydrogenase family protein [Alkalihalobacillus sp. MEB130]MDT8860605.1 UDP-glucose/GDP-mannose dehydrogenase family protein [Alkalihalobacillus sp. MEB130]